MVAESQLCPFWMAGRAGSVNDTLHLGEGKAIDKRIVPLGKFREIDIAGQGVELSPKLTLFEDTHPVQPRTALVQFPHGFGPTRAVEKPRRLHIEKLPS